MGLKIECSQLHTVYNPGNTVIGFFYNPILHKGHSRELNMLMETTVYPKKKENHVRQTEEYGSVL